MTDIDTANIQKWAGTLANTHRTMMVAEGRMIRGGPHPYFPVCGEVWWDTPTHRVFSLRSTPDGLDVAAIAKGYGGGGHRHAAGFQMPHGWAGDDTEANNA